MYQINAAELVSGQFSQMEDLIFTLKPTKQTRWGFYYEDMVTLPAFSKTIGFSVEYQPEGVPYATPGLEDRLHQPRVLLWKARDWQGKLERTSETQSFLYYCLFDDNDLYQLHGNSWQANYFWSSLSDGSMFNCSAENGSLRLLGLI